MCRCDKHRSQAEMDRCCNQASKILVSQIIILNVSLASGYGKDELSV